MPDLLTDQMQAILNPNLVPNNQKIVEDIKVINSFSFLP